ncbi:MAG: adenylate/guanylate cyclase domain-containing protein, partial [Pseudomonadota bacterium]
ANDESEIERWLLDAALEEQDLPAVLLGFVWRMVSARLPVHRFTLHVGTLHPELFGYAWTWLIDDEHCDEIRVDEGSISTDAYRLNPISRVIDAGERMRVRPDSAEAAGSPLMQELAEQGITDYAAVPLNAAGAYHNAATVATRQAGGFGRDEYARIERLLSLFALHVERDIASRIGENIVTTYLGAEAGEQVLRGTIKRGAGRPIDAIIWASDLRDFTVLSDRLDDRALTSVLNAYFECLAGAVMGHSGEVLKFIGDGMLAVFPIADFATPMDATEAALQAAEAAFDSLDRLNADPNALPEVAGWRPLRTGIGLHHGEVFFGNVGAPRRLDFTVIGKAVNTASRVQDLCRPTGKPLLITEPVCELSSRSFGPCGTFELKGLSDPIAVFAPAGSALDRVTSDA